MADLSISTLKVASGTLKSGTAGATIAIGDALYKDSTDSNHLKLADCTTSSATATFVGLAATAADDGDVIYYAAADSVVEIDGSPTTGETYVLSVSGAIAPVGDLTTNDYVSHVGVCTATNQITVQPNNSGVQKP